MRTLAKLAAAGTVLLFSGGIALAECVDPGSTASTSAEVKTPPMAKDGSKAPMEAEPTTDAQANAQESDAGPAQKDGGTMPLASSESDDSNDIATSQQDVEAQQEGEQTAAAKADDGC